jgi:D-aspartate ligase
MTDAAVILGMYVNGYSIARALDEGGVEDIIGIDVGPSAGLKSNLLAEAHIIEDYPMTLYHLLLRLREKYDTLVMYPTSDDFLRHLAALHDYLPFCGLPYNRSTVYTMQDKDEQYRAAARCGVPVPAWRVVTYPLDYQDKTWMYAHVPHIIKPLRRKRGERFRNIVTSNAIDLRRGEQVTMRTPYLVSEVVPPTQDSIFAYTCYRSSEGKILAEWVGHKLNQYPDDFGVFSSAENTAPDIIRNYGRRLVEEMDLYGIVEPEFRKDWHDGEYKLMEVNLRSAMWHRVGALSGVNLPMVQWCDMTGQPIPDHVQHQNPRIVYKYGHHEIINTLRGRPTRPGRSSLAGTVHWAFWNPDDLRPWLADTRRLMRFAVRYVKKEVGV